MGGDGEAIESIAGDVGATPWERKSEMAGKPRDARECRDMQKRAVSRLEPKLSLQRGVDDSELGGGKSEARSPTRQGNGNRRRPQRVSCATARRYRVASSARAWDWSLGSCRSCCFG